jgi:hypothetical protein
MDATCGVRTVYPSRAPTLTPIFNGVRLAESLVFCARFFLEHCPFVLYLLAIVLSGLFRLMASNYLFCIFKHFLLINN